ncbi:UDP-2,3-diacylglucosamine diphosphatase LpxI [Rhodopseudomonas palustris]|uniref:LpxI family protein n=1 Tax=Rhodopseudomonas palustris TaxID=1076 RepID=UPI002ACD7D75|nr:UDP-2,3-diacylglucosamine diphosphatase LpxI [Rhodopseudomonas palustris]WQH00765.1 UDP-2,3-diacylglucosamine diphosphatase LpxI [Rhodopseudomonas palustris]
MTAPGPQIGSPIGVIAGGGALPFAVADAVQARQMTPLLIGLRGFCDPNEIARYRHHWISIGQFGRLKRLLRAEHCRDVVFIGSLIRPALTSVRLDWGALRVLPSVMAAYRGGDDHLLTSIGRIFEREGFRLHGVKDVAPELLMPPGELTRIAPDAGHRTDIARGRAVLAALSPFDIGQAVIVIEGHVVAVEDIGGTDALLANLARLRAQGRIAGKPGRGVLVKAPKSGQDLRFDLPTLGPRTIEGVAAAGLAGIAVAAGNTLVAEPQAMIAAADRAGLFVTGVAE